MSCEDIDYQGIYMSYEFYFEWQLHFVILIHFVMHLIVLLLSGKRNILSNFSEEYENKLLVNSDVDYL